MRFFDMLALLEQDTEAANQTIPADDLNIINTNIDEYLKYEKDLSDEQRKVSVQSLARQMQDLSRKLPPDNKYDGFIRHLYDKDKINETLTKIKDYNDKLLATKHQGEV